jgi:anti-sigma regulatory factor (Ser/Thr protein kinase)
MPEPLPGVERLLANTPFNLAHISTFVTALALAHPQDLPVALAQRCDCKVARARRLIKQLLDLGWLHQRGTARRASYAPGTLRQVVMRYALAGLEEDLPWARDFAPCFDLPATVRAMVQHAFTELLNNAIDHSEGSSVVLSLRQTSSHVQLLISDDGRGLFDQVRERLGMDDPAQVMLELCKGRLSSQPERHTGRGLFFTARLADIFDLHANQVAFQQRAWAPQDWTRGRAVKPSGSSIYLAIALDTPRTLDQVLRSASLDSAGYGIEQIHLPLRLLTSEQVGLASRAQARKVAHRLTQFKRAELDFSGVDEIGQGFADELFRVFARQQDGVQLVVRHAGRKVQQMIEMAQAD